MLLLLDDTVRLERSWLLELVQCSWRQCKLAQRRLDRKRPACVAGLAVPVEHDIAASVDVALAHVVVELRAVVAAEQHMLAAGKHRSLLRRSVRSLLRSWQEPARSLLAPVDSSVVLARSEEPELELVVHRCLPALVEVRCKLVAVRCKTATECCSLVPVHCNQKPRRCSQTNRSWR